MQTRTTGFRVGLLSLNEHCWTRTFWGHDHVFVLIDGEQGRDWDCERGNRQVARVLIAALR
jgi:hypothetical protein